jgi:hypothetical protein
MLKVAPWMAPKNHEMPFSVEERGGTRSDGRALTFTVYDSPDPDCQVRVCNKITYLRLDAIRCSPLLTIPPHCNDRLYAMIKTYPALIHFAISR